MEATEHAVGRAMNGPVRCGLPQGASCDVWAKRSSGERYPELQGRGPQISDMSALRWEDGQTEDTAAVIPEPPSEHAEVRHDVGLFDSPHDCLASTFLCVITDYDMGKQRQCNHHVNVVTQILCIE